MATPSQALQTSIPGPMELRWAPALARQSASLWPAPDPATRHIGPWPAPRVVIAPWPAPDPATLVPLDGNASADPAGSDVVAPVRGRRLGWAVIATAALAVAATAVSMLV